MAITDGALLVRRFFDVGNFQKVYKFSFMPHVSQARRAGQTWKKICQNLGFGYIDPTTSVEQVLSLIAQTETLITEAMHGAIIADALRVPWIPVVANSEIFGFKWLDWCFSVGIKYQPEALTDLAIDPYNLKIIRDYDWNRKQKALERLVEIAEVAAPNLSDASKIESLTIRLEEKLQQFRKDVQRGYFEKTI